MRVGRGVAVSGKMFHGRQHAGLVRPFDVGCDQIADLLRVFAKRARVDDGIGWVRVDISIGKEIPMDANGPRFLRRDAAKCLGVVSLAIGAKGHRVGKIGRPHEARGDSTLEICGDQQGQLGVVLHPVQQLRRFVGLAAQKKWPIHVHRHGKRTDVVLLHGLAQLQILRALHVEEAGAAPDHEDLTDLFF